ncbi:UDP-N-acetylglucosamine--dolichyl-phosphate N-acetylglucosaminephosphotransferase [Pyrobaculum neutrophilum]|uniref:Glycosyl transferase family 4 n=1 Tax=Pyrobaculum neutrophilum (strain DSM 2338 / JCM 9278 / NBRC 100436 / V24Sta) TaxID=444157 RepID=B1YDD6_PYRNV|nr:UDP-N-acetylglucosamine--dolichyl-phosphate N-acetylglucosaminephosphotransferase [Pyrobaculum neutrophilum]ACB39799.1 glycosyl transferase family 4 [Pyrobaculum neutrophilum V24Sta]
MLAEAAPALVAFTAGVLFGRWWIPFQRGRGITSRDIYKGVDGVPRAGGLIAMVAAAAGYAVAAAQTREAALLLVAAAVVGLLGLLDDLRGVSEYVRVLVPVLLALVVARALEGGLRFTIPLIGLFYGATGWLAALAIPVVTNAFNMLDPVNGFLPAANMAIGAALAAVALVRGQADAAYLLAVHVAASAALYIYNRYPARAFNGNVGSYFLGANISTIAVLYDLVAYLILAATPFVVNGALIVFSSGGIKGREKIQRPTSLSNGVVKQDCSSPILSLVRLVVADRPMGEYEIFKALVYLVLFTSAATAALAAALKALQMPI